VLFRSEQNRNLSATENQELSFGTATEPNQHFGTGLAQSRPRFLRQDQKTV
jgi:hypothetical protein